MYCTFNFSLKIGQYNYVYIVKCSHLNMHCHIRFSILISTEGDACPSGCSKSCECPAAVGGGVVGGFVGGVLMTAVAAAVIFVVFAQRMRSVHMRIFVAHCYWSCFS